MNTNLNLSKNLTSMLNEITLLKKQNKDLEYFISKRLNTVVNMYELQLDQSLKHLTNSDNFKISKRIIKNL